MIRALTLALCAVLGTSPALATSGIYCEGVRTDSVGVTLTVGRVPGLAVVGAVIEADGRTWQYQQPVAGADEITLAQATQIGALIVVDFTDAGHELSVASLRIVTAASAEDVSAAGVLSIAGIGTWPLVCDVDG